MLKRFDFVSDESGATAIGYMISSGVGMVVLAGVDAAGKAVNETFGKATLALGGSSDSAPVSGMPAPAEGGFADAPMAVSVSID
ncbi:MAG: hypothetical protein R3D02_08305 [Hyphomicrobiales bacterium]